MTKDTRILYQSAEMTAEEMRRIETSWKSDVDRKLDKLLHFMELMATRERLLTESVDELTGVLATGKGGLAILYLVAKIMAAIGVITAAAYGLKAWILK